MRAKKTSFNKKLIALVMLVSISATSAVSAQTLQRDLPVDNPRFGTTQVVQRRSFGSDSLFNGALIGVGAGVAVGLFVCTRMEPWRNCRDDYGTMARIGAIGAGIGIGIDALLNRRSIIEQTLGSPRLHTEAIVGRRERGLRLSFTF